MKTGILTGSGTYSLAGMEVPQIADMATRFGIVTISEGYWPACKLPTLMAASAEVFAQLLHALLADTQIPPTGTNLHFS